MSRCTRGGMCGAQRSGNAQTGGACAAEMMRRSCARQHEPRDGGPTRRWLQCAATDGALLSGPSQMGVSADPQPPGDGECVGAASFAVEVRPLWSRGHVRTRPGRWLRVWFSLMCLETQGSKGCKPAPGLDGVAHGLTLGRLASTYISEVPRSKPRRRPVAARHARDQRLGRSVGNGHSATDGPR